MSRKIVAIIKDIMGDQVVVSEYSLSKVVTHLKFPPDMVLVLLEVVLRDPSDIFLEAVDESRKTQKHYLFYRLTHGRYLVAVVKKIPTGAFLCTMHLTGKRIRNKHKQMKRIK